LVETACKTTIFAERGKPVTGKQEVIPLVRRTAEELQLLPANVSDAKGADVI
jgi:hypothetical protein